MCIRDSRRSEKARTRGPSSRPRTAPQSIAAVTSDRTPKAGAEVPHGEHGEEHESAGDDGLHDRQGRERERADVQAPGHNGHDPPHQEPFGAEETDGTAQRMADADRRGEHRAAVLEQKRDVGGQRRSKREDQYERPGAG